MPKLTKKLIDSLKPTDKDTLHFDDDPPGFGVIVYKATGKKSYVAQRRLPGKKNPRRVTIGAVGEITLEQARKEAADMLHKMRQGKDPKAQTFTPTLRWALDNYLEARKGHSEGTVRMYKEIERNCPDWMHLPLTEITGDMMEKRHREIPGRVRRSNPRYKGETTANFAMKTVGILYGFAKRTRFPDLPENPVKRLERQWFKEKRRTRKVKPEELPAFYQAVRGLNNDIHRDFILMMMFTGMRRSEVMGLRWAEVDFTEKMIRLPAERTKPKRELHLPMSDMVHTLLVARRAIGDDGGFVFPGDGKSCHLEGNIDAWKTIEDLTGITVSAHDMRRTFASVAGETEMSPFALKAMLNHSSDITGDYVIISPAALRAAVQKVADRMKELCQLPIVSAANVVKLG